MAVSRLVKLIEKSPTRARLTRSGAVPGLRQAAASYNDAGIKTGKSRSNTLTKLHTPNGFLPAEIIHQILPENSCFSSWSDGSGSSSQKNRKNYGNTDQYQLTSKQSCPTSEYMRGGYLFEFSHNEPSTYDKTITTTNPASNETYPDRYLCSVLNGRSTVGIGPQYRIP